MKKLLMFCLKTFALVCITGSAVVVGYAALMTYLVLVVITILTVGTL